MKPREVSDPCICGAKPHHRACYAEWNRWWKSQGKEAPPATREKIKEYNQTKKYDHD